MATSTNQSVIARPDFGCKGDPVSLDLPLLVGDRKIDPGKDGCRDQTIQVPRNRGGSSHLIQRVGEEFNRSPASRLDLIKTFWNVAIDAPVNRAISEAQGVRWGGHWYPKSFPRRVLRYLPTKFAAPQVVATMAG